MVAAGTPSMHQPITWGIRPSIKGRGIQGRRIQGRGIKGRGMSSTAEVMATMPPTSAVDF
jgi:hypothetical protein